MSNVPLSTETIRLEYSEAQHHALFDSQTLGRFRFFPKGRRLGITRGTAQAFIEWMLEGKALLWGDTINANIDRYFERYFRPVLKQHNIDYRWNQQKRLLTVGEGYTDFRSADRPENWEGFGYHVVFLNEAGIILNNRYLYENAVLPMLIDNPNSQLIAAGTPKLRQGKGRLFVELKNQADQGRPGYYTKQFSTFDNPWLALQQIRDLANEIPEAERAQEIYGDCVEMSGTIVKREWLQTGVLRGDYDVVLGVDLAISKRDTADYTACVAMARDVGGMIYVLDAQRIRGAFHEVIQFIEMMAERWKPVSIAVETVQYQAAVVQELMRTTLLPVRPVVPERDKITRFHPLALRYEQSMITHAPQLSKEYEDELLAFPIGDHDDLVDAAVYAFQTMRVVTRYGYQSTGERRMTEEGDRVIHRTASTWGTVSGVSDTRGFI